MKNKLNAFIFTGGKKRLAVLVAVVISGVLAAAGLVAAANSPGRFVPQSQASLKALHLHLSALRNGPCTEQFVKTGPQEEGPGFFADDVYFFSAALERPVVGLNALDNVSRGISSDREKENYGRLKPDRIVVAPSGDMAYEYGTENIRFDERKSGKHFDFTAAYLRVWKAVDGSCRVAAQMQQPEANHEASLSSMDEKELLCTRGPCNFPSRSVPQSLEIGVSGGSMRRTTKTLVLLSLLLSLAIFAKPQKTEMSDTEYMKKALSAAPKAVADGAKVIRALDDGSMKTIREGGNGFTCMVMGRDSMCNDANSMEFIHALMKKEPPPDKVGISYMLAGDEGASNTDPYARGKTADNHWLITGPHIMVFGPPSKTLGYTEVKDPDPTKPYMMWAGTPYEHAMIPVGTK